ncbi:MAG: hypothetical protein BroJett018_27860 [Chloroflexota bacterium]|nr:MAG: hypothetical protein BroJett018_27860 [Chloroflexota bacterium]
MLRVKWMVPLLLGLGLLIVGVAWVYLKPEKVVLTGQVMTEEGPAANAVVRVRTSDTFTVTDENGRFELETAPFDKPIKVTAWSLGYLTGESEVKQADTPIAITLTRYYTTDNPDYAWFSHEGATGSLACSNCHVCYDEWLADAHSRSAVNPRVLSVYNGTDLNGTKGAVTQYEFDQAAGIEIPLAPSLGQDGVGVGFRLDYPDLGGNCATCHAPAAALNAESAYQVDMNTLSGIETEGVFCEFCHKTGAVTLNPVTNIPNISLPGVLSMQLYRPAEDEELFFGNLDDVPQPDTYLPLFEESAFCAPCHTGNFWGTTIYNSYGEWLASPYSDPERGKTCQDCHMPPVDYEYFVFPERGGLARNPETVFSHRMPGAADTNLLENTAELDVKAVCKNGQLAVTVAVTNTGAGHDIPTDNPLRNVILVVNASTADGQVLTLTDGPTIPEWGGVGDPEQGYYAGLPGVLYAKILADYYTGETPSMAYWRQTRIVSDNRIHALETDETHYQFDLPNGNCDAVIDVQLLLRRAFIDLMDQKAWDTPDMLMEQVILEVR